MARFAFRLATLLKLREAERDSRRARLAEALGAEAVLRERIARLDDDLRTLKNHYQRSMSPGAVDVDRLLDVQRYEALVRADAALVAGQRELLVQEIEKRRQALVEADRTVRSFEKLREKQHDRHRQEQQRQEGKQLDEIGVLRAAREEHA